jgi:PAS domain S-box-containing protein
VSDPRPGSFDLVVVVDEQGRFAYVSPSSETILGYAPAELLGTSGFDLVHADDVERAAVVLARRRGESDPDARIFDLHRKEGGRRRVEAAVYPLGGDSALAGYSIVTLVDLEAREAEQRRERAVAAQLETVLRTAPVGLALVDREHRFVFVNDELAAIDGLAAAEHPGRKVSEVVPDLASDLIPLYERVLVTGEPIRGVEIRGETPARAGEQRFWEASYHPVLGPDGVPEGVIAVVQETTQARREEVERVRLQRLVELSGDFVAIARPDGSLVYHNAAARRLAGFSPDEDIAGRSWLEFVDAEEHTRFASEILPALEANGRWEGPAAVRNRRTGERAVLEWITLLFDDPDLGPLVGAIARDERERRAAEARALESTQALEALFALSPVPILSVDLERRVVRANPATHTVFGWPEEELVGRQVPFEPEATTDVEGIRREMREGRVASQRLALRRRDGKLIRVAAYASPQRDATGAHVGSIGFIFDVEELEQERERAEKIGLQQEAVAELGLFALTGAAVQAVLERAAELLATRLEVGFASVAELQPGGQELRIVAGVGWREGLGSEMRVDAGAGSQAGYTLAAGEPVLVEDVAEETRFTCAPIVTEHGIVSGISTVIGDGDGTWGVLAAHSSVRRRFSEDDVNFLRAIANVIAAAVRREETTNALRALTGELEQRVEARTREAEAAREAALEASIAKTDFLSRISHELRTPLNAIVGFGQLLAMEQRDPETRESVDQILAAGLHLVGLIDELLDVSQIEARAIELETQPVDLVGLVDEVVNLVSPLAADKGVGVGRTGATSVVALADQRRLRQVLLNLLSNAIKYNREGGAVEIALAQVDGAVAIAVRDTGLGIAEPDVERIFEPFQRVPGAARVEGTGLGLAVSRGLVEAMGGTIRVESTPGAGSVFTVELPVAP